MDKPFYHLRTMGWRWTLYEYAWPLRFTWEKFKAFVTRRKHR